MPVLGARHPGPAYAADVAALAYVLLPLTGTCALLLARSARVRLHGAQAIVVGLGWGGALYGASLTSAAVTRVVWGIGALVWVGLLIGTALGKDPVVPGLRGLLEAATATDEP